MTSTKRFGARYGRKPKAKFAKIEAVQRSKHKCPSCLKKKVTRLALGIWQCKGCDKKFAGKAYTMVGN